MFLCIVVIIRIKIIGNTETYMTNSKYYSLAIDLALLRTDVVAT